MIRYITSSCVPAIVAFSITISSTHALTIVSDYVTPGNILPGIGIAGAPSSNTTGGGNLQSIFNVAASMWEQLIQDDFTLVLHYGWYPTEPVSFSAYHSGISENGAMTREIEGSIVFNNDNTGADEFRFYLDPTPSDSSEFAAVQQASQDLGGGSINTQRDYAPDEPDTVGSIDLLTTALHEIGHALGMSGWHHFLTEVSDGDIDVTLSPYNGTTIPMRGTHIGIDGTLMSSTGIALGHRREISQLDLLAACQLSQFANGTFCRLSADFNSSGDVDESDFLLWQAGFGTLNSAQPSNGDADLDGNVDGCDFVTWQNEYQLNGGASATDGTTLLEPTIDIPTIPEPVAGASGLLVLLTSLSLRRRRCLFADSYLSII